MKARAQSQRETRERIAKAAVELHEQVGVRQATVTEIARRAGVTRLTVYNHFPDLSALLPACSAHYLSLHPPPTLEDLPATADPVARVRAALTARYGWYRETESLHGKVLAERASVPELDAFLRESFDREQGEIAADLVNAFGARGRRGQQVKALIGLALDFWTWNRLAGEGLDDETAAGLMAGAVASAAAS